VASAAFFLSTDGSFQRLIAALHVASATTDSTTTHNSITPTPAPASTPEPSINRSDPLQVADEFVKLLVLQGALKEYRRLGMHPGGVKGFVTVHYYMDYLTRTGLRREGQYAITLQRSSDGSYKVWSDTAVQAQ